MDQYNKIWYEDIMDVFKLENLIRFIPFSHYSIEDKLNAIWLFSLYFCVLVFIYNGNINIFLIFIFVSIFTYIFYKSLFKNEISKFVNGMNGTNSSKMNDIENDKYIRKPTIDNPFMNANIVTKEDPNNVNDNIFDSDVSKKMNNLYYDRLIRDIGDVYETSHSQRQFYTMPSTSIPNSQDDYAKWLYGNVPSCKDNQRYCLQYEDPRFLSY